MTPTASYKRYVAVLLTVVYICNLVDRTIFGLLMEPIKAEFGLSDTQLGFLLGPALIVFYAGLGVPVARWADRSHRVNIMSGAIALWSCVVMLTAAVQDFSQLTLMRVCVGIGEAGFSAVAMSVIADYYAGAERTRALANFMLAVPISLIISNLFAGWINEAYGWRTVFIAAGLPGLLLVLLMKGTVREPERFGAANANEPLVLRAVWAALWRQRPLRHLLIAQGLAYAAMSCMNWAPAFFMRNHGLSTGELGTWLALIGGVGGGASIWLSGILTSRYAAHEGQRKLRLMAAATALVVPVFAVMFWAASTPVAFAALLLVQLPMLFFVSPTLALAQDLADPKARATMASIFILVQMLAAGLVGIQLVGLLSDALTGLAGSEGEALRWSMTLTSLLAFWAARHFWLAGHAMREQQPELLRSDEKRTHL